MVTKQTKRASSKRRPRSAVAKRASAKAPRIPKRRAKEGFYEYLARLGESLPDETKALFPPDASENLDHYVYGTPKRA